MNVLFVGDPNLGPKGLDVACAHIPSVAAFLWTKGDTEGRAAAHDLIVSRQWDVAVSFYNDLIFTPAELAHFNLGLNIHPALPSVPGVGYDTVPLARSHTEHGATLHEMTSDVDAGQIYDVVELDLRKGTDYLELRRCNQLAALLLLERTMGWIARAGCAQSLRKTLVEVAAHQQYRWSDTYWTYPMLKRLLREIHAQDPNHPAVRKHPLFFAV